MVLNSTLGKLFSANTCCSLPVSFLSGPCSWQARNARGRIMFWMQSPTYVGTEIGRQMHNLPCRSVGIILICILRCFQEFSSYTEETVTHSGNLFDDVNFIAWFPTLCQFPIPLSVFTAAAAKSLQSCPILCDPIDGSHQAPPSLGFSRQEHWSGLPFPSPMHESEKWKWSRLVVSDS